MTVWRLPTSIYTVDGHPAWSIQVCDCGFPLGGVLVAIKLKTCPDCGRPTIPVEDVTTRVEVAEVPAPNTPETERRTG